MHVDVCLKVFLFIMQYFLFIHNPLGISLFAVFWFIMMGSLLYNLYNDAKIHNRGQSRCVSFYLCLYILLHVSSVASAKL